LNKILKTNNQSNLRFDIIAGISVALVALPIALALAVASGFPPMAGIVASAIGGIFCTFFRGSKVAINGPGAGLIVVLLASVESIGYPAVLAAIIFAGIIQFFFGLFRMGRMGSLLPSAVIFGMLAFVGIAIFAKQFYVMLGVAPTGKDTISILKGIPNAFTEMNPFIFVLSFICLAILVLHSKIKSKFVHFIPAPVWVLIFSITWVLIFNMDTISEIDFLGFSHEISSKMLIDIPNFATSNPLIPNIKLLQIGTPDFSKIGSLEFWQIVISITLISSIYSIVGTKAVDKLDPQKRTSNLNKELMSLGIGSILSAFLGGLPIVTAPVQSSVNINHNAKTKWSNFVKGLFLMIIVLYASQIIKMIPNGALAAILVFTGYKLASPKLFKDTLEKGWEQFMILGFTILASLFTDLISGVLLGAIFALLLHFLRASMPLKSFLNYTLKPSIKVIKENDIKIEVSMKGVINFINFFKTENILNQLPKNKAVIMDFSHARLVDYTTLENIHNFAEKWERNGGQFSIIGLEIHSTSSSHPYSLHILESHLNSNTRKTRRQVKIKELAANNHWTFDASKNWKIYNLKKFPFFYSRPLEYTKNRVNGTFNTGEEWVICDTIFDEGALIASEEFHTTTMLIALNKHIPKFTLEKEKLIDRLIDLATHEDINLNDKKFSHDFALKGENKEEIIQFFDSKKVRFFNSQPPYHIESCGEMIIIFRNLRFATESEIANLHDFAEGLVKALKV
jgi:MFS superfamily sulfate permease-like transporter